MKLTTEGQRMLYALRNQEWLEMPLSAVILKVSLELSIQSSRPATPDAIEKSLRRRGVPVDIASVPPAWIEVAEALVVRKSA